MKRIDVTIIGHTGESLREESVIDDISQLPKAVMRAVEEATIWATTSAHTGC